MCFDFKRVESVAKKCLISKHFQKYILDQEQNK